MSNTTSVPLSALPLEAAQSTNARAYRAIEWIASLGCAAVLLVVVPALYQGGAIDITMLNQIGRYLCYAILALGLDLVWGYTGILSLCQAMFFCIGGYAIGMHMALHGPLDGDGIPRCLYVVTSVVNGFQLPSFWKPFQTLPMAIILAITLPGIAAFIFGYFTFRSRVRGVYFSIITQAITVAACYVFRRNEMRLCGTNGLTNFVTIAGFDVRSDAVRVGLYELTAVMLVAVFVVCKLVSHSRLGRLLIAVRDSESRLRFAGYNPVKLKLFVFTLGAMIAGLAGALYTPQNGIITPYKMEASESILIVVCVAVGGRGTLSGAVLGTLLVFAMQSWLTSHFADAWMYVLGGLFIAVPLYLPDGLVGLWRNLAHADAPMHHQPTLNEESQAIPAAEGAQ